MELLLSLIAIVLAIWALLSSPRRLQSREDARLIAIEDQLRSLYDRMHWLELAVEVDLEAVEVCQRPKRDHRRHFVAGLDPAHAVHQRGALDHLAEVRTKIADLRRMERVLATMVKACAQGTMPACPLLETLAQAG